MLSWQWLGGWTCFQSHKTLSSCSRKLVERLKKFSRRKGMTREDTLGRIRLITTKSMTRMSFWFVSEYSNCTTETCSYSKTPKLCHLVLGSFDWQMELINVHINASTIHCLLVLYNTKIFIIEFSKHTPLTVKCSLLKEALRVMILARCCFFVSSMICFVLVLTRCYKMKMRWSKKLKDTLAASLSSSNLMYKSSCSISNFCSSFKSIEFKTAFSLSSAAVDSSSMFSRLLFTVSRSLFKRKKHCERSSKFCWQSIEILSIKLLISDTKISLKMLLKR